MKLNRVLTIISFCEVKNMYKGKYINSSQPCDAVFDIRQRIPEFGSGKDSFDDMAIYALVFDESDVPVGSGRLRIDADNHFRIDYLGVLPEQRRRYIGDLLARMLLYKAQELNAASVHALVPLSYLRFFARYGFKPVQETDSDECQMYVEGDNIILEGSCSRSSNKSCPGDCSLCK